jgi:hypothetical protein
VEQFGGQGELDSPTMVAALAPLTVRACEQGLPVVAVDKDAIQPTPEHGALLVELSHDLAHQHHSTLEYRGATPPSDSR